MASLSSGVKYGNASASALIKQSGTISSQIHDFQDKEMALQWSSSAQDQAAYDAYSKYLQSRITNLQSTGSLTDASKALTLTSTLQSAGRSYTSNQIQNVAINVLEGNATLSDKQNAVLNLYSQAANNGDMNLAQNLRQQYDSINQQIQYQQQVAQQSAITLANAQTNAIKNGYNDAVSSIDQAWKDVMSTFQNGGEKATNQALKDFTAKQAPIFKALGIDLPKGTQLTMGGLAQAVMSAKYSYYTHASTALAPTSPSDSQSFAFKAQNIVSGNDTLQTPAGSMSIYQINQWAQSPNLYRTVTDQNGKTSFAENAISGYKVVNGQVIPQSNGEPGTAYGNMDSNAQNAIKQQLSKLGLTIVGADNQGGLKVQFNKNTDKWTQFGNNKDTSLSGGTEVTLIPQPNGGFQFVKGNSVYSIGLDTKGLAGIYRTDPTGVTKNIAGQYGFNQKFNTVAATAAGSNLQNVIANATGTASGMTAAAARLAAPNLGNAAGPRMVQRSGGGYNFTDAKGNAISAARYAQLTGTQFRTLLQTMANGGDAGAKTALGFVGNDFGYDPTKVAQGSQQQNLYNALTWGVTKGAPASLKPPPSQSYVNTNISIGGGR